MIDSKLILLTGASGKIGSVITENLLKRGWEVLALTKTKKSALNLDKIHKNNHRFSSLAIDLFESNIEKKLI